MENDPEEKNIFSSGSSKLLTYQDQINCWLREIDFTPVTLEIQPTERCNQRCPDCQAKFSPPGGKKRQRAVREADLDLRIIDTIFENPPQGIILSGNSGDPLLHPQIGVLLDKLEKFSIPTVLITNGQALTLEIISRIFKVCQGVRISLDACDSSSYKNIHGVNHQAWDQVMDNISKLLLTRRLLKIDSRQCLIGAGYLTGEKTIDGMMRATKLVRELGFDYIQFRPFHFDTTDITSALNACRLQETPTFRVLDSNQKYSLFHDPARNYTTCHGSWFFTVLDARGDLYICCHHIGNPKAYIGSLKKKKWSSLVFSKSRRGTITDFDVSGCIPFCRLDSHNRMLESIKQEGKIRQIQLDESIRKHAPFL